MCSAVALDNRFPEVDRRKVGEQVCYVDGLCGVCVVSCVGLGHSCNLTSGDESLSLSPLFKRPLQIEFTYVHQVNCIVYGEFEECIFCLSSKSVFFFFSLPPDDTYRKPCYTLVVRGGRAREWSRSEGREACDLCCVTPTR